MKAIFATALLCCFFVSSFTAPIEQEKNEQAQAKAEAKLKARLFTKFDQGSENKWTKKF